MNGKMMQVISVISSKLGKYPGQLCAILFEDTSRNLEQKIYHFGSHIYRTRVEIKPRAKASDGQT